jgi:hypothetical protein
MTRHRYSDDDLARAVAESTSIAGVLRLLGIRQAGGSHFHISKRVRRMGLDASHFTGQGHNRGKRLERLAPEKILVLRPTDAPRARANLLRRALLESGVPGLCAACGAAAIWMDRPLTLHVDHIDGDVSNCLASNLRFLCPNCHSQTSTYCRQLSSRRDDSART